ncbi:MAG: LysR family transcriptional regulator [Peptostreptococcaceae bacterium]|nr:LysR family transcriptional regulator [Peptostreptococcaceae bacterium]
MRIDHLVLFNKIASEKSISKVAEECHLSQPALSQQMRKLEDEMGLILFERSNKGIKLTANGRIVHQYFEQIIETYNNLQQELTNLKNYTGTIRILASPVIGQYALPCSIHKMNEKFPKYTFALTTMLSSEVVRKVLEGKGNIGFIISPVENQKLVCNRIHSDKVFLVCSKKYYKSDSISLENLKNKSLITLVDRFSSRRIVDETLKNAGHDMKDFAVMMELDSTESLKASVIAGLGFAFLPYMAIKKEIYLKELKIVEIPNFQANYDLYMIYRKKMCSQDTPQEVIKYFLSVVEKTFC